MTSATQGTELSDLADVACQLRENANAIDWLERRRLAQTAANLVASGENGEQAMELLRLLAFDSKWEVRWEVAEQLLVVPDEEFAWFAEQLESDSNHFVRQAMEKALVRRSHSARKMTKRKKENERLARQIQRLEAEFGEAALKKVLRICQRHSDQLVGAMAHDLRAILSYLKSCCRSLNSDRLSPRLAARLRDYLTLLENTVNDMEAFAEPASPERRSERLLTVVVAAIDLAKENVCKCQLDPSPVGVQLDVSETITLPMARHLMLMAFANVIKNAYESFADSNGKLRDGCIRIDAEHAEDSIAVAVADDGMGMTDEELADIASFRPGRRNKSKRYSTGFGLPIADRNVAAHGGSIEMTSSENAGTTVTIILPLQNDEVSNYERESIGRRRRPSYV